MLQCRSDVNLGKKSLGAEYGGELGEEDFYGDFAAVTKVFSEVDCRHSAAADFAVDAVSISECC
jgi:hypothetical protein